MECENCRQTHSGTYGSGRFCSGTCARSYSTKNKRKIINEKVSKKIKDKIKNGETVGFSKPDATYNCTCAECGKKWNVIGKKNVKRTCSIICTKARLKRGPGGYRQGAGHGKRGWYKGIWCDSSWELAWVMYSYDHGIKFKRNSQGFEYVHKGQKKKYFPDFILESGEYVEIKGWTWIKTLEDKIKQFPHSLRVLFKDDLKIVFDYVTKKYGKNFTQYYTAHSDSG